METQPADLDHKLQERFGLPSFRPWQREAVEELLDGTGRVLAIAPTGGGKSLCYQFPATELEGTTIVVSPLIALMEDQVRALNDRGIEATYVASNLSAEERRARIRGLHEGRYRLVYVAPERLAHPSVLERLRSLRTPLVAIDEAHCISQWGHDFRPDYLKLGPALAQLAPPRVLACTATATPDVREEILEKLGLGPETHQILRGFARPNLHLTAEQIDGGATRKRLVFAALKEALGAPTQPNGAAIVYAGTRKKTEELADDLSDLGYRTAGYHAGIAAEERGRISNAFADRELDVVVATNAFGMGIDRPDIRAVVHFQAPGSIEAYYQEVGRAGRDGQPAVGLLITGGADIGLRRRLIELGGRDGQPPPRELADRQWKLFRDLLRYVEAGSCRHDFILRYFGDEQELLGGCGHCDVCERLEQTGGEERTVSDEDALTVRKALSGVARAKRRVGLTAIAKHLHGDDDKQLQRWRLDRLSTHGLLAAHPTTWIQALLRRLLAAGLVDITPTRYPIPYLTPAGVEVMKGDSPVRVLPPPPDTGGRRRRARSRTKREPPPDMDEALFERLREARLALAKEKGVPAYVICHDRTLMEIAAGKPTDLVQLGKVPGMGPARLEAYGDRLLSVVGDARA
ncbi:MAG TPA: ATP-dependent DNA helicase RecQ [Sandaracinaceae bacterium LLY-WYZ-13_1]|nr:ATP-dependent DNA helicase RecQ [Sandaracinaceae bacterium LLY-WYZ-13_1]